MLRKSVVALLLLLVPVASVAFLVQQGFIKSSWLDKFKKPAVPPIVETFKMDSTQTGKAYSILVQLPPTYRQSTAAYPVMYSVHIDPTMFEYTEVIDPLRRRSKIPEVIVVHVSPAREERPRTGALGMGGGRGGARQRNESWLQDTTRTPWTNANKTSSGGKSEPFVRFFDKELIPKIDGQYRTVPGDRLLMGYDYGAVFTVETALTNPELFNKYMVLAPIAEYADFGAAKLAQEKLRSDYDPALRIYMVMGENDHPLHFAGFEKLKAAMGSKSFKKLQLQIEVLPEPNHALVVVPGAQNGLKFLFKKP